MSNIVTAPALEKAPGDSGQYALVFDDVIPADVTISSVDSFSVEAASDGVSGLTISALQANDSEYEDPDPNSTATYRTGSVALYSMSGGSAGDEYRVHLYVTLSNGWTREGIQPVKIVG